MKKEMITLSTLGTIKQNINYDILKKWDSSFFEIKNKNTVATIDDFSANGNILFCSDEYIATRFSGGYDYDLLVVIIDERIEDNYYMRIINKDIVVISLYQMAEYMKNEDIPIENYILRNIYEVILLRKISKLTNTDMFQIDKYSWIHEEVRCCIFDLNWNKVSLLYSMNKPKICHRCIEKIKDLNFEERYIDNFVLELKKIDKSLWYRAMAWIRHNPIKSALITFGASVTANMLASILLDLIKKNIQ